MKRLSPTFFIILTILGIVSCSQKQKLSPKLSEVKETVHYLDSLEKAYSKTTKLSSEQEREVNARIDEIVSGYKEENRNQMTADSARKFAAEDAAETWGTFVSLCDQNKFEQALNLYFCEKNNGEGKNAGDFMVYLQHSSHRYMFYSSVLFPLMTEYRDMEFVLTEYADILQIEKAMEDLTIAMNQEGNGYVPNHYPLLITELGRVLAVQGKVEDALALVKDLISAMHAITDDVMYSNYYAAMYGADVYEYAGDTESAISIVENYKDFLNDNPDLSDDTDEIATYRDKADEKILELKTELSE